MTVYKIKDWERVFEVSDSRKVDGPLKWVAIRTSTDGFGYARITQEKNRCELFAAWYLMVALAARQNRIDRGKLSRDGVPLTPDDMELVTRFPSEVFERAIAYFSKPEIGWLIPYGQSESVRTAPDASGQAPAPSEPSPATGQDRTIQDKTVGHAPKSAAKAAQQSDSEWLASLKANPAYAGLDVDREYGKMVAWCQTAKRQPNRRRFVNWLNRCERPMNTAANTNRAVKPIPEPRGWKSFLNREFPDSRFSAGQNDEAHEWSDLDAGTQRLLVDRMRSSGEL